ncbi:porin [Methylorubrum salsuginis]|uniref:Porin n=1 Tax=Methylorubrum salsuginis TaxID=414703 RepID=A0A1I4JF77_9HYPH|nr:porin [Methylorubrum salsuginis]SFL65238.1 Porin subfamily protein [Methylorubrum salsuginis]
MKRSVQRAIVGVGLGLMPGAAIALERAPLPSEAPMEACPGQGAGFARIPGTSTCLRVSGRVAAGVETGTHGTAAPVRGRFSVDTRSDSDLGPVRSFLRLDAGHR